ncbi:MAG: S41 family peptidase [Glaciecola sp.]
MTQNRLSRLLRLSIKCVHIVLLYVSIIAFTNANAHASNNSQQMLSAEQQMIVINALHKEITNRYINTHKINDITDALQQFQKVSVNKNAISNSDFAQQLTVLLQAFDKHFSVSIVPTPDPNAPTKLGWYARLEQDNFGFTRVEVDSNNIGYLSFWGFPDLTTEATAKIDQVMAKLATVDALVIDLTENGGGSTQSMQHLASYFLSGKVLLNSFYERQTNKLSHFYTFEHIENAHLNNIPITVLIGPNSFSAAEAFAYNLKHLNRAVIVGQTSKGGANSWLFYALTHGLRAAIPISEAINPITHSNWEAVGVIPDIHTTTNDLEGFAKQRLLKHLQQSQLE